MKPRTEPRSLGRRMERLKAALALVAVCLLVDCLPHSHQAENLSAQVNQGQMKNQLSGLVDENHDDHGTHDHGSHDHGSHDHDGGGGDDVHLHADHGHNHLDYRLWLVAFGAILFISLWPALFGVLLIPSMQGSARATNGQIQFRGNWNHLKCQSSKNSGHNFLDTFFDRLVLATQTLQRHFRTIIQFTPKRASLSTENSGII